MRSKIITVSIALALAGALVAPASAAQAASGTVSGTVEYKGKPVAGIPVGWFKPATGSYRVVTTASDGSYSLDLPGAGQEYVLFGNLNMENRKQSRGNKDYVGVFYGDGDTRDYAYQTIDPYTATATADEVDIELAKPGRIIGTDPKLADELMTLETMGGTQVMSASTDSFGYMSIPNLVPGQYRVTSSAVEYDIPETILTVESGEITKFTPHAFTGGVISGVVTGAGGKPAKGVEVVAHESPKGKYDNRAQTDVTDSKGRYSLPHLFDDEYRLTFGYRGASSNGKTGDKGYVPESEVITGITADSRIVRNATLATGGRFRGTFANTATSYNTVTLVTSTGTVIPEIDGYGVDGAFNFGSLPTGKYTAYFSNGVGTKFGKKTFTITAGSTTELGKIVRDKTGFSFTGTIADFSSSQVDRTGVLLTKKGGPSYAAFPHNSGRFSAVGLVPGTYSVEIFSHGRDPREYTVSVTRNTTKTVALGHTWGSVSARFTVDGLAIPSGDLTLGHDWSDAYGSQIKDGAWKFSAPSGTYGALNFLSTTSVFQANSPNWLTFPDGALPVTVTGGTKKNLGAITLEAH
jgi:hypothetical protein